MKYTPVTFGLIAGAVVLLYSAIVLSIFNDLAHLTPKQFGILETLGYLRYIILLLAIFIVMRSFKQQTTSARYWDIAKQGMYTALVIAICIGIMEGVYILLNSNFYTTYAAMYAQQLKANGATEQTLQQAKQQMEAFKWMQTPTMTGVFYFFETSLIGCVAASLFAIFMKSKTAEITN